MRIAIFYEHAFEPGGAPVGVRHLADCLSGSHVTSLWGKAHAGAAPLPGVRCRSYTHVLDLVRRVHAWLDEDRPDVVVVVGFFLWVNLFVVRAARRRGLRVVLHPLAQVDDSAFAGKIFTKGCDVRALEGSEVNSDNLAQRLATWLNPYLKLLYKWTVGRVLARQSTHVAVLSAHERRQFQRHYGRPDADFVALPWGIDAIPHEGEAHIHYYRDVLGYDDDRPNFVVWSRLDWHYKGLDRLLEGVRHVCDATGGDPGFRLFLCGPDYREGSVRAGRYIAAHGLQDVVQVLPPGRYKPGSKIPLRDADASILLSRWDGSPRALRESLYFGTPILVSRETNFGGIVQRYDCGLSLEDADDAAAVAAALRAMGDRGRHAAWVAAARAAAQQLDWQHVARRFADSLEPEVPRAARPALALPAEAASAAPPPLSPTS